MMQKIKLEPPDADDYSPGPLDGSALSEDDFKPLVPFRGSLAPLAIQPVARRTHNKAFTCDMCLKGVGTKGGLKYHIQAHLNGRRFKCNKCEKSYATRNDLDTHYKRHLQQFTCDHCDKKFAAKDYLLAHICYHHLPKFLPCIKCCRPPKYFATNRMLQQHYKKRSRKDPRGHKCEVCGCMFAAKKYYQHCEQRKLLKYECKICNTRFPCRKLRDEHAKREQTESFCKKCNKFVKYIKQHDYSFHRVYKCNICNVFEATYPGTRRSHERSCGTNSDIVALGNRCVECGLYFPTKTLMHMHLNAEHPRFWCRPCSRSFNLEDNLKRHVRRHANFFTGEHHYKCILCTQPVNFRNVDTFRGHFELKHGRLGFRVPAGARRVFVCDACKRARFTKRRQLEQHVLKCRERVEQLNERLRTRTMPHKKSH